MTDAQNIIGWNSKEGKKRLFESNYSSHFYALSHLFERQIKPTYCGIASSVMVLKALRLSKKGLTLDDSLDVKLPGAGKMAFNCYTQITFFNHCKKNGHDQKMGKSKKQVEGKCDKDFDPGFSMQELASALRLFLLDIKIQEANAADQKQVERFRHDLMAYLNESKTFVIANFHGKTIERDVGGHFSPITAYHPETDSCLVMDVAGHKAPWFWAPVPLIYSAMNTKDSSGTYRGYLVVSDKLDKQYY